MTRWPPRVIAFDGDDTLWHNETIFSVTQERFRDVVSRHVPLASDEIGARLIETERRNLGRYGYGIKGFVLSMVETALDITEARIPAEDIRTIMAFGRAMIEHPVELIDGAPAVLETLRARDHELWLVTKGDLFDQESKIARSGLIPLFTHVEIVSEKDEGTYRRLLDRHGVDPSEFAMIGNSLRSDVLPVVAIGARAFHVPYHLTWAHEMVEAEREPAASFHTLAKLADLPQLLNDIAAG